MPGIRIKTEGPKVRLGLDKDGSTSHIGLMSAESALELATQIRAAALRAQEVELHEMVAQDHAILVRSGAPIGIAFDPRIQAEGEKLAQYDPKLRRYMPGGVKAQDRVGAPTIHKHQPTMRQWFKQYQYLREKKRGGNDA